MRYCLFRPEATFYSSELPFFYGITVGIVVALYSSFLAIRDIKSILMPRIAECSRHINENRELHGRTIPPSIIRESGHLQVRTPCHRKCRMTMFSVLSLCSHCTQVARNRFETAAELAKGRFARTIRGRCCCRQEAAIALLILLLLLRSLPSRGFEFGFFALVPIPSVGHPCMMFFKF